jgi:hypothetical protein
LFDVRKDEIIPVNVEMVVKIVEDIATILLSGVYPISSSPLPSVGSCVEYLNTNRREVGTTTATKDSSAAFIRLWRW